MIVDDIDFLLVELMMVVSALLLAAIVNLSLAVDWQIIVAGMMWRLIVGEALRRCVYHGWCSTAKELCCVDCWHDSPPQTKNGMSAEQNPYHSLEQIGIYFAEL